MPLEQLSNRPYLSVRTKIKNIVLASVLLSGCGASNTENKLPFQVGVQSHPHEGTGRYLAFVIGTPTIRSLPVSVRRNSGEGGLYSQTAQSFSNVVVMDRLCCPRNTVITTSNIVHLIDTGTCISVPDHTICQNDMLDSNTRIAHLTSRPGFADSRVVSLGFTYPLPPNVQPAGIFYAGSSVRVASAYGEGR